ncbi:hypothetical protein PDE_09348 [Penicillium oxalicum 114-2]|uniref:Uncharacterized protein n=1 Tax=Penicillium oxalicum (strain 114-2 / CGMCC 5302) TaxID=933388 RepID=S7ZVG4_PENO1|nr:hypothetical protein PDE_09348 [Penicillium oxalicum 114-2]
MNHQRTIHPQSSKCTPRRMISSPPTSTPSQKSNQEKIEETNRTETP